jgi:serine/threonine-protein kinase ULK/ATG1
MNENPSECEIAYDTALWMLYAILDETMQEGEPVGEEDKVHVQNCKSDSFSVRPLR